MKFVIHSYGCKVNTYDSGLIQKNLSSFGHEQILSSREAKAANQGPVVHVLNTCAVTGEATKEAVRQIRRLKAKDPFSTVVVTGCAAQVDTGAFSGLPGADLVVANSHKGMLPQILDQFFKGELKDRVFKSNIFRKEDLEMGGGEEKTHTRSFLKIQDGCNSFCTYCIIPYARGKSRSIAIGELVRRVNEVYSQGVRETVLTGVHIGDYEDEIAGKKFLLEDLLEQLLAKTKMPRFRLSSLEPVELSERLLDIYRDDRMCPHFHMSIQSANTDVLREMKRKYTQGEVRSSLLRIAERVPGAFVGMDVIAGFPTETEEQFEDTYKTLAELPWTRLHVFPYSERAGTRAAAMVVSVPMSVRAARAQRLRELSLHRFQAEALKQIGQRKKVLLLKNQNSSEILQGLSRDYWPIEVSAGGRQWDFESEVEMKIEKYELTGSKRMEGHLLASVADAAGGSL